MGNSEGTSRRKYVRALGFGVGLVGIGSLAQAGVISDMEPSNLGEELDVVRDATAKYHDPAKAVDDGYLAQRRDGSLTDFPSSSFFEAAESFCGRGFHFVQYGGRGLPAWGRVPPKLTNPDVLVYGADGDQLVLGAVKWMVNRNFVDTPPDIFEYDDGAEAWLPDQTFAESLSLYAWVHADNLAGVFEPVNPRGEFSPDNCLFTWDQISQEKYDYKFDELSVQTSGEVEELYNRQPWVDGVEITDLMTRDELAQNRYELNFDELSRPTTIEVENDYDRQLDPLPTDPEYSRDQIARALFGADFTGLDTIETGTAQEIYNRQSPDSWRPTLETKTRDELAREYHGAAFDNLSREATVQIQGFFDGQFDPPGV